MTYREALKHLNSRQMFGIKLGLNNITRLLKKLGNPEQSFKSVHIAGTNGKGSTAAILASLLQEDGYSTGLYTSPHISSVCERVRINGIDIRPSEFAEIYADISRYFDEIPCTYFECTTALAFRYFSKRGVEVAVIETGLGGRFDATNVILPVCSVITSISRDHQEHLGDSIEEITREKCGIMKKGVPAISSVENSSSRDIIRAEAERLQIPLYETPDMIHSRDEKYSLHGTRFTVTIDPGAARTRETGTTSGEGSQSEKQTITIPDLSMPLPGTFQVSNAKTALAAFCAIRRKLSSDDAGRMLTPTAGKTRLSSVISSGLSNVVWKERFTVYRTDPTIIIDVAHNEDGFSMLYNNIRKLFPRKNVLLIIGMKENKNWEAALKKVLPLCSGGVGIPLPGYSRHKGIGRGVNPSHFGTVFRKHSIPFRSFRSVRSGVRFAWEEITQRKKNEIIVCSGSHYTVNAVKKAIKSLD